MGQSSNKKWSITLATVLISVSAQADPAVAFREIPADSFRAQTELLADNPSAWYARWKAISEARQSIYISVFSVHADIFGRSFLGLLLKKAEEGVQIRLLIDSKASAAFAIVGKDWLEELMINPNIQIRAYNPLLRAFLKAPRNIRYLLAGMHDKMMVIDDKIAISGGRNFASDYYASTSDMPEAWRDSDILISGDEVLQYYRTAFEEEFNQAHTSRFKKDFGGNWIPKRKQLIYAAEAMDQWLRGEGLVALSAETEKWLKKKAEIEERVSHVPESYDPTELPAPPVASDMYNEEIGKYPHLTELRGYQALSSPLDGEIKVLDKLSFIATGSSTLGNHITENLIRLIDSCETDLMIQNPYVVMTPSMFAAIKRAHDRGVSITIHTNSPISTDSLITQAFFALDWDRITQTLPNAKVYVFTSQRKLHSKVFVFDGKVSVVGSYNMDSMSETINSEIVSVIHSEALAQHTLKVIDQDLQESLDLTGTPTQNGVSAPEALAPKFTRFILRILKKMKWLRPLA